VTFGDDVKDGATTTTTTSLTAVTTQFTAVGARTTLLMGCLQVACHFLTDVVVAKCHSALLHNITTDLTSSLVDII